MKLSLRQLAVTFATTATLFTVGAGTAQAVIVRRAVAYRPVARAAVAVGTVAVTAAVVGSIVHSLPPQCTQVMVSNVVYQQCGSTWYQPQYAGSQVNYVVVNPPR